ncbi:hypothetical protein M3Y99_01776900 [Aphelenchoides fujianensis]|nr:hypothetical protein M3Y99_01776900 [Aphelenchoides fujianensis]
MSVYFVHCNVCQRMPDKHVQFFVGECGHIACSTCVEDVPSRMQPKCEVCNRKIRLQLIGPEMRGKEFFMNPVPMLDGIINKLYDRALVLPPLEGGSHQGDAPQLSLTDASTSGVKPHVKPRVRSQQTSFAQPRSLLQKPLATERHKTPEKPNTPRIQQPSFAQPRSVQLKSPHVKGILRKSQTLNPPPVVIAPAHEEFLRRRDDARWTL